MAKQDTLLVLHLTTEGKAAFKRIPHTLEELQKLVGGYLEPVTLAPTWSSRHLLALVNEDGRPHGMRHNPFSQTLLADVFGMRLIVGDAVVLRERGAEFASLTDDDQGHLRQLLEQDGVRVAP